MHFLWIPKQCGYATEMEVTSLCLLVYCLYTSCFGFLLCLGPVWPLSSAHGSSWQCSGCRNIWKEQKSGTDAMGGTRLVGWLLIQFSVWLLLWTIRWKRLCWPIQHSLCVTNASQSSEIRTHKAIIIYYNTHLIGSVSMKNLDTPSKEISQMSQSKKCS